MKNNKYDDSDALNEFDIVHVKDSNRKYIAIEVTQKDLDLTGIDTVNTDRTGLHLFGGFWHGEDPKDRNSYGKILDPQYCNFDIVATVEDFSLQELKEILD